MPVLDILGNSASPQRTAPPAAPTDPNAPNLAQPTAQQFIQNYIAAAAAHARANPTNLFNWLSGRGTDAATAEATALAPSAWQQFQSGQSKMQSGQLDVGQDLMMLNRARAAQGDAPIDANNIPGSYTPPPSQQSPAGNTAQASPGGSPPDFLGMAAHLAAATPQQPLSPFDPQHPLAQVDALFGGKPVDPAIVQKFESNNDPNAVSPIGGPDAPSGLMQVRPSTAAAPGFGVTPSDGTPAGAARVGRDLLPALTQRYNSPTLGLIAYNWGPGNTDKWLAAGADMSKLPAETRNYVGNIVHAQTGTGPGAPAATAPQPAADTPQSVNPLQSRRAMFMRMATTLAGLPKFAGLIPEYAKQASQGLPDGTAVLPNGEVGDAISGQPITGNVASLAASKAGAIATAEQAPRTAGTMKAAAFQAGLDRETNWQKYGAENAFKGPQLLRAPDGSVVGVTPAQMAANATNGALSGYRPLTEEDQKALGDFGVQYAKDQASLPDVRQLQTTLGTMLDQAKSFPPGTFGGVRHAAGQLLTGLGVNPDDVAKAVGNPAGADVIVKNTLTLAMDRLKSSFGGGREAGFVVQMAQRANPNIETQPEAYNFMLNTMSAAAQRQADYITAQHAFRQQHGSIDGFAESFDKTNPTERYVNQAVANTYGAPKGSQYVGRNQGRPVFVGSNGKKFMVTR